MSKKNIFFSFLLILVLAFPNIGNTFAFDSADDKEVEELEIVRITPSGKDVEKYDQIVFQFNKPVVPIGKMERKQEDIPITIKPAVNCKWRWMSTSALACYLDSKDKLKKSTEYKIKVKKGIKDKKGKTIKETMKHSFITQRPIVVRSYFEKWEGVGKPRYDVVFNQYVTIDSVRKHIFFKAKDKRYDIKAKEDNWNCTSTSCNRWEIVPEKDMGVDVEYSIHVEPGITSHEGPEKGVEDRKILEKSYTIPEFELVGISCSNNDGHTIYINAGETSNQKCSPDERVYLRFTSMASVSHNKDFITPKLKYRFRDGNPINSINFHKSIFRTARPDRNTTYTISLPQAFKGLTKYEIDLKILNENFDKDNEKNEKTANEAEYNFYDHFSRPLLKAKKVIFETSRAKPSFNMPYKTGVLEQNADTDVISYATNIKEIEFKGNVLSSNSSKENTIHVVKPKETIDTPLRTSLKIKELIGKSGIFFGKIKAKYHELFRNKNATDDREVVFQVTPFNITVKDGCEKDLVWVTDLQTGDVVEGVTVTVFKGRKFEDFKNTKNILENGITDKDGLVKLSKVSDNTSIIVKKGDDIGYVTTTSSYSSKYGYCKNFETKKWGVTAQGVHKPGQTVKFKLFVRKNKEYQLLKKDIDKEYNVVIKDPKGNEVFKKKNIKLTKFGNYSGEYSIPKNASTGWYNVYLNEGKYVGYSSDLRFLVTDFVPAAFHVETTVDKDFYQIGDTIKIKSEAKLHSGGPYTNSKDRINIILDEEEFRPKNPDARGFSYDLPWPRSRGLRSHSLLNDTKKLNNQGILEKEYKCNHHYDYGKLIIESSVQDDRGKNISSSVVRDYYGKHEYVGLKASRWKYNVGKPIDFQYITVDRNGDFLPNKKVDIKVDGEVVYSSIVKGAGGTVAYHYTTKTDRIENKCDGITSDKPVSCSIIPQKAGIYTIYASGKEHEAGIRVYVDGTDEFVWPHKKSNKLVIKPQKKSYKVGEKAEYLIESPYKKAKALITIEKFGVIKSWVQEVDSNIEFISFDVTEEMHPGFYLSVTLFTPRVEKEWKEGEFDPGSPNFKMGYVSVPVSGKSKYAMDFSIKTNKEVYRPGEEVNVDVNVKQNLGGQKSELTAIVLDEGVLDLIKGGINYFSPSSLYGFGSSNVMNYNNLESLLTFASVKNKGNNPSGGGKKSNKGNKSKVRDNLKNLAYWNPSIETNRKGNASFSFKAPDNLTGWRVIIIATNKTGDIDMGSANFKVSTPIEIQPAMPNQVMEGDKFKARFSVLNKLKEEKTIKVDIKASGNIEKDVTISKEITLNPFERKAVTIDIEAKRVPEELKKGNIDFVISAGTKEYADKLTHSLPVNKYMHFDVGSNYGTTTKKTIEEEILFPKDMRTDAGNFDITLSQTVIGDLEGAFEYMKTYSYTCWEQKISMMMVASQYGLLKKYVPDVQWDDYDGLIKKILKAAPNYQAPNGGMGFFKPHNEYVSPYLSAYTGLAFIKLKERGYEIPETVNKKLLKYLKKIMKQDSVPSFYSDGMLIDVRAVTLYVLQKNGMADKTEFNRNIEKLMRMSLMGQTYMLKTALELNVEEQTQRIIADTILSKSDESGGKFKFTEELNGYYNRILYSSPRNTCAALSGLLDYAKTKNGHKMLRDIPIRIARSIREARKSRTHWENTQENVFCLDALAQYSSIYEKETPKMELTVSVKEDKEGELKVQNPREEKRIINNFKDKIKPVLWKFRKTDPGKLKTVKIDKNGEGRIYYSTKIKYALSSELNKSVNAGLEIQKEYHRETENGWELVKDGTILKRGDVIRVDLYLNAPSSRNFVVVDDPVPGCLEPVNSKLATSSIVDARKGKANFSGSSYWFMFSDWQNFGASRWSFYHKEFRHDAVRFYSDYISPGNYHLAYVAQVIAEGEFRLTPTFAGEMYDQDIYGKSISRTINVQ